MKFFGATDTGLVRKANQDSYIIAFNETGDVFVIVCDGIGGSNAGDVASMTAINYLSNAFSVTHGFSSEEQLMGWMKEHLSKANDEVFTLSTTRKEYHGMGTTLVGLVVCHFGCFVVNVGDSRCYGYFKNGVFRCCTVDHNLLNDLVRSGEATVEEAQKNKQRNYLTNALGVWNSIKVDVFKIKDPVDTFLLCTDGLHGYVAESDIEKMICDDHLSLQNKNKQLIQLAMQSGGYDNTTVVLVKMEEGDMQWKK